MSRYYEIEVIATAQPGRHQGILETLRSEGVEVLRVEAEPVRVPAAPGPEYCSTSVNANTITVRGEVWLVGGEDEEQAHHRLQEAVGVPITTRWRFAEDLWDVEFEA